MHTYQVELDGGETAELEADGHRIGNPFIQFYVREGHGGQRVVVTYPAKRVQGIEENDAVKRTPPSPPIVG
jgi:hypothetical protein